MREYISNSALTVISDLENSGFEAYLVGGCVRDMLMQKTPSDFDICTNARPQEIIEIFKEHRCIPTGLKHGTVTVLSGGESFEITTYRIDGKYSDSRHPQSVEFSQSLSEDLRRRDFTVNSMAYHPAIGVIDLFDGVDDIKNKTICCVGNADERLREDALRILRALRFSSVLEFNIEEKTAAAAISNSALLCDISSERISSEFVKLLCGQGVKNILLGFRDILEVFIPEIRPMAGFDQKNVHHYLDVWSHTAEAVNACASDEITRLAAFFHDIGKPHCFTVDKSGTGHFYGHAKISRQIADEVLKRLRFDNKTADAVTMLVLYHDVIIEPTEKCIKRWLGRIGEDNLQRLLDLKKADTTAQSAQFRQKKFESINTLERIRDKIIKEKHCFCLKDLKISGDELITLGIPEGRDIGKVLNYLLNRVIDGEIPNEKDELICDVKENFL